VTVDEMRALVRDARVGRLATIDLAGAPHLVPFCYVLAGDVLYSAVDRKPKRTQRLRRLANAAVEPRVSSCDHYEEDWFELWWCALDGIARELPPDLEATHALVLLAAKYRSTARPGPTARCCGSRSAAGVAGAPDA